jgi:hypothetical protein
MSATTPSRCAARSVLWLILLLVPLCGSHSRAATRADASPVPARSLIIVHPPHLAQAARRWSEYRTPKGWQAQLLVCEPGVHHQARALALQSDLRAAFNAAGSPSAERFAVLLLGDVDAPDAPGIPTWRYHQFDGDLTTRRDTHYATDHPYQLMDDADEIPDVMLGRIPAATNEQALALLDKITQYERHGLDHCTPDAVAFVAGEGGFGLADHLLEWLFRAMVDRFVPPAYRLSMTYAKPTSIYCPPPDTVPQTIGGQLTEGALLFNYVGHGSADSLGSMRYDGRSVSLLTNDDVNALPVPDHAHRPIALLGCCSTGWYDGVDGRPSLAETMLLHDAGPVAVIAGSRLTHPYGSAVLQKDITDLLLRRRIPTVGELDVRAMQSMLEIDNTDLALDAIAEPLSRLQGWDTSLRGHRRMHARLYNLLGDPCTIIQYPHVLREAIIRDKHLHMTMQNIQSGTVTLTIETTPDDLARPSQLMPITGADDPDLSAKARHNHALANQRVLKQLEMDFEDGRAIVRLPDDLPLRAAIVRIHATSQTDDGRSITEVGAVTIPISLKVRP